MDPLPRWERYFSAHSEEPSTRDVRSTQESRGRKSAPSVEEDHRRRAATQEDLRRRPSTENSAGARGFASPRPDPQGGSRKGGSHKGGSYKSAYRGQSPVASSQAG